MKGNDVKTGFPEIVWGGDSVAYFQRVSDKRFILVWRGHLHGQSADGDTCAFEMMVNILALASLSVFLRGLVDPYLRLRVLLFEAI